MTDITGLREDKRPQSSRIVHALLDRLEAAEAEALEEARLNGMGSEREAALLAKLEAAEKERDWHAGRCEDAMNEIDALRAKIEAMERQEPVAQVGVHKTGGNAGIMWSARPLNEFDSLPLLRDGDRLYLAPGAQPAQMVVAYLDLGVGGYMDIGTDLTDEALAALPKGRHMLGIVGTYGVDGYVPAQNAPSVLEGYKLVPIEPTPTMITAALESSHAINAHRAEHCYRAMLAAAPEAKT